MIKYLVIFVTLLPLLVNSQTDEMTKDFANLKKYAAENKEIAATSSGKIIFMGDSITEFWKANDPSFFAENSFINRGISGQTTSQMLVRFPNDVLNLTPATVVILAGINDIAENNGPISIENCMKNIVSMVELAQKNNIEVILCSVLPANKFSWRPDILPAKKVIELNTLLLNYATTNKIVYIDYYSAMVDDNKGLNPKYGGDGVHPNLAGYKVMEAIFLDGIKRFSK